MIRLATEADLADVAALESDLFGSDAWDEVALRAELEGVGRRFVVVGGEVVAGYAVSRSIADVVDLQRIGVAAALQRTGMATALLDELLAHPGEAERMMLEVSAVNLAAIEFYRRNGFAELATRPRYYRDGSDALVMSRDLASERMTS
ncbi:MAG: GNAT family N-acetyltransferase [Nocardioides sp.]|uniref:GNAT family N-acetyltransferase n=1 Tax=Nocardioides sp. TaxID=35761 RepID=UPI003266EF6B